MRNTIIAAMLLFSATAAAQDKAKRSPEEMAKARTERLTTVLELTPEQAAKVNALHLAHAQEAEARRTQQEAKREAMRAEMNAKRERHQAEMKSILTAEQFAKWEALNAQRKERDMHRRHRDPVK
jgi:Spy/CpxP family protein refolding chaperone